MKLRKITPSEAFADYNRIVAKVGTNPKYAQRFDPEIATRVLEGRFVVPDPDEEHDIPILTTDEACGRLWEAWKWSGDYDDARDMFEQMIGCGVVSSD